LLGNGRIHGQNAIAEGGHHVGEPRLKRFGPLRIAAARAFHALTNLAQNQEVEPQIILGDATPLRRHGWVAVIALANPRDDIRVD